MSMLALETGDPEALTADGNLSKLEAHLLANESPTFTAYYNGKMSYKLAGKDWTDYVVEAFPELKDQNTSENVFKAVIDLYAENLLPMPKELKGFSNTLPPLLMRGAAPVIVDKTGQVHYPEHYEMMSDGQYTIAAVFTRNLRELKDYVVFVDSNGLARTFAKKVPVDMSPATREGYEFVEEEQGYELFRFALDDKGFGATLSALQDRLNHSIIDQTVVAEMYARPFWYLLNVSMPPKNPYLPAGAPQGEEAMREEKKVGGAGRVITTSGEGPFGQLEPPTINDMIAYHDSIIDKVPLTTGIPQHYFKPGSGVPPTGVALKVLMKRFQNKISRMRDDIEEQLIALADVLGIEKTVEVKTEKPSNTDGATEGNEEPEVTYEYGFWNTDDDLLQEALDAHGLALIQMGYPLEYVAEVVTPGVDLDDYMPEEEEGLPGSGPNGEPVDMTAMGQQGLVATPGQVAAYGQNPGQRAKA